MWSKGLAGNWSSSSSRRRVERYAEIPKEAGRAFLVDLAGGDVEYKCNDLRVIGIDDVAVDIET